MLLVKHVQPILYILKYFAFPVKLYIDRTDKIVLKLILSYNDT